MVIYKGKGEDDDNGNSNAISARVGIGIIVMVIAIGTLLTQSKKVVAIDIDNHEDTQKAVNKSNKL